jgi:hypothetical protein
MAKDWARLRVDIERTVEAWRIRDAMKLDDARLIYSLYRIVSYFNTYGKYGHLIHPASVIDHVVEIEGFAEMLRQVGWLIEENGHVILKGFTDIGGTRKGIGGKLRREILASGACAACGASEGLEIDHKIPICRGGDNSRENLQALCVTCNRLKWKRTMEEFLNDR